MSDTNDKDKKPAGGRKPLSLKGGAGGGTVRQNFSGGRSKSVVVETKKRRVIGGPSAKPVVGAAAKTKSAPKIDEDAAAAKRLGLSKEEYVKRKKALNAAQAQQEERESKKRAEAEARTARAGAEQKALDDKRIAEEQARIAAEEAKKAPQQPEVKAKPKRGESAGPALKTKPSEAGRPTLESMGGRVKKAKSDDGDRNRNSNRGEPRRRQGKLTIASALSGNEERQRSLASVKRARQKEKDRRGGGSKQTDKVVREVVVPEAITLSDLANRMAERAADVVKYMMKQGEMMKMNDVVDADTAQLIVEDFGHTVKRVAEADVEDNFLIEDDEVDESKQKPRPAVIAVMGHVDHGKTSLIDALRTTDVASGEAGGITQHIGAYQLKLKNGDKVTVLDTPGHAAFSEMRTRGAQAVDIVVLVVAADDSVKPQTIESIKHAQAAGTPLVVAINKVDVYEANPLKVQQDLLQYEVITEAMSGETQAVEVSALKKTGLDQLVEAITLQAELLDLKANPERNADGVVIESKMEKGRGPVATLLVKRGTLERGDIIVAGEYWGKVKAMTDERNARLKTATPSMPIEVMGLDGAPDPGMPFSVVKTEQRAREITEYRHRKKKENASGGTAAVSMEQMMARLADKSVSEMAILVKADVQGSAEAIKSSAEGLGNDEVKARVVSSGVGGISESDVMLAKSSSAPIIAFNVRANRQAKDLAEREGVEIRYYSVIYDLLDDIKGVLEGMLAPEKRETFIGYAEVLEVFNISKLGKIAGSRVTEGKIQRGAGIRLLRDDVVIHEGEISTLKRFKDEVEKVNGGMECGIGFKNYFDIRKADVIECFTVEMIDRTLD